MATVDEESPVSVFPCHECGEEFDSRDEVVTHWRDAHSAAARKRRGETADARERRRGSQTSGARRTTSRRAPRQPRAPQMSPVRTGLTLCYALAGQGFGMFGPEPRGARAAVSQAMMMTAGQGGYALDRLASRTPVYKFLNGFFGAAGVLEDATPLGIPLIVGMYAYAPPAAQDHLRPMAGTLLGMLLLQTFGPEPPSVPEDATPMALPPWIREFVDGLLPRPKVQTVEAEPMPGPTREAPAA